VRVVSVFEKLGPDEGGHAATPAGELEEQVLEGGAAGLEVGERALVDEAAAVDHDGRRPTVCAASLRTWLDSRTVPARRRPRPQERAEPADAARVEPVGRLVEDQEPRVAEEGRGQAEALAHAQRVAADPAAGGLGEPDDVEDLGDPAARQAGHRRERVQVGAGGAARVRAAGLDVDADQRGGRRRSSGPARRRAARSRQWAGRGRRAA
jgi:hypothetical protein